MNTETLAKNALVFLSRVDLKGAEAAPFNEVAQWISSFIPKEEVSPEKAPKNNKNEEG